MEKMGLCCTCEHLRTCIFNKKEPILECEEFYTGNSKLPLKFNNKKAAKFNRQDEITAGE